MSSKDKEVTAEPVVRRRKSNCPVSQTQASVYFAEQSLLNRRFSKLASDAIYTGQRLSVVQKKYNEREKGNLSFVTFVSTNPLINSHKDGRGRRSGVIQRNSFDSVVLTEIMSKDGIKESCKRMMKKDITEENR